MNKNQELIKKFINNIKNYHLGDQNVILKILSVYFSGGHILINDVPGTGKSHLSSIISKSIKTEMKRVQFTADMMASDLIGVKMFDPNNREWEISKGPIFSDIVFADEINRAPPQTQSALLEAMSEKQVTIEGETFLLSPNHFVIATQNPNEFDGIYPLPEAQLDRFSACITLGYLNPEDEVSILMGDVEDLSKINPILNNEDISNIKTEINNITLNKDIAGLIVKILNKSREYSGNKLIKNGLSVRAGIAMRNVSKAYAYLKGYSSVHPDLIFELAPMVFSHRLSSPELIESILREVKSTAYEKTR